MLKVHSSLNTVEIYNLKNALESRGIQCEIRGEHMQVALGRLPLTECWTELWIVEDSMKEMAESIIEGRGERQWTSWTCPKCSESVDGEFGQCWNCQAYRRS